jgi:hypothetical protein
MSGPQTLKLRIAYDSKNLGLCVQLLGLEAKDILPTALGFVIDCFLSVLVHEQAQ